MLNPNYFDKDIDLLMSYYQELETWMITDISNRLLKAGEMSGTADRRIYLLTQLGLQKEEIQRKIKNITKLSDKELKALLQDAVLTSWKDDDKTLQRLHINTSSPLKNKKYLEILNAEYLKCQGEFKNLTRTAMDQAQKDLIRLMNAAELRIASGTQSYSSAICEVLDEYAKTGVQLSYPTVNYYTDTMNVLKVTSTRSIESAVQTAIRTSMNQTAAQLTNQYIVDNGIEYVLVSAHEGARHSKKHPQSLESHDWWQGKVFKIRGSEDGIPNLAQSTGYDIDLITGAGRVINPLGLHGYNCRHSHQPWNKEFDNPWEDKEGNPIINKQESIEKFELLTQQRNMERSIRQSKRQVLAKEIEIKNVAETDVKEILQQDFNRLSYKLREKNKKYNDFCSTNNLQKQQDRIKVMGYTRDLAAKANGAATKYKNQIDK